MRNARRAATGATTGDGEAANRERAAMLTVSDVAEMLSCSTRSVYRLSDAGKMPRPVNLGALVRWPGQVVEEWIAEGCPRCIRKGGCHG